METISHRYAGRRLADNDLHHLADALAGSLVTGPGWLMRPQWTHGKFTSGYRQSCLGGVRMRQIANIGFASVATADSLYRLRLR